MPSMIGQTVIYDDDRHGYVAVAVLSDGTRSMPMGAPLRDDPGEAVLDCEAIRFDGSGPTFHAELRPS